MLLATIDTVLQAEYRLYIIFAGGSAAEMLSHHRLGFPARIESPLLGRPLECPPPMWVVCRVLTMWSLTVLALSSVVVPVILPSEYSTSGLENWLITPTGQPSG